MTCSVLAMTFASNHANASEGLKELTFTKAQGKIYQSQVGPWKLIWNQDENSLAAENGLNGKKCVVLAQGAALPDFSVWKTGSKNQIVVYGETVVSDLTLADLDTCQIKKSNPGVNTQFDKNGYHTPVSCGDASYPNLQGVSTNPTQCESAKVYKLNSKKFEFIIDKHLSIAETKKEIGVPFFGTALITDIGKPTVRIVK
jgi:hypothetical protein